MSADKYFCDKCLLTFKSWGECRTHLTETQHSKLPIKQAHTRLRIGNFPYPTFGDKTVGSGAPAANRQAEVNEESESTEESGEGFSFDPQAYSALDLGISSSSPVMSPKKKFATRSPTKTPPPVRQTSTSTTTSPTPLSPNSASTVTSFRFNSSPAPTANAPIRTTIFSSNFSPSSPSPPTSPAKKSLFSPTPAPKPSVSSQHPPWAVTEAEPFISTAIRRPFRMSELKKCASKQNTRTNADYLKHVIAVMQSDLRIETDVQNGEVVFSRAKRTPSDAPWTQSFDKALPASTKKKQRQQIRQHQRPPYHHQQQLQETQYYSKQQTQQQASIATTDALASVPSYFDQVQRQQDLENDFEGETDEDYDEEEKEEDSGSETNEDSEEEEMETYEGETSEEEDEESLPKVLHRPPNVKESVKKGEVKKSSGEDELDSGEESDDEDKSFLGTEDEKSKETSNTEENTTNTTKSPNNNAKRTKKKNKDATDDILDLESPEVQQERSQDLLFKKLIFGERSKSLQKSAKKLERGFSLGDRTFSRRFAEAAFFGRLTECPQSVVSMKSAARLAGAREGKPIRTEDFLDEGDCEVYLNTHEPFCLAAIGVQGAGKSHTMAVVLESCLLPCPYPKSQEIVRLKRPMTALVLHYDQNITSICEATGLISAIPALQQSLHASIALPREKMIVLVSPSYYLQRKKFYGDYCIVKPLLFSWANLTADHIKKIMRINEGDNQLYVASMLDLLRSYQRSAVVPEFQGFLDQVREICTIKTQAAPLLQRISLLEAFVAESQSNASIVSEGADLYSTLGPGCLVIADLTDPLLSSQEANGIFQVLTEQFRTVPAPESCGKLLALDEAHKFMDGEKSDGLSNAIVNAARLMRHDGMRVVVSSQSPKALAPELLELVSVAVLHRFHSRDWFEYLRSKIPLNPEIFDHVVNLPPGTAVVFAARHLVASAESDRVMKVEVRRRLTADRGSSKLNLL